MELSKRQIDPDFWKGRRVLLTGHTGFKGSWLSLWLHALGADVHGLALPSPTHPSLFETIDAAYGMTSCIGDIRDYQTVARAMSEAEPEIVLHMAAQPLVRLSYGQPVETYATNVMGTVHVLEAARHQPSVRAIVNVTTDKCYENREWVWGYRENEPMGGADPYSSSKGCAELVSAAYRSSYFNPADYGGRHRVALATARAGNVIGGGDWAADRLIPDILRAFEAGQSVAIRNPLATRPWQHVLEPLSGYLLLAQDLHTHGAALAEPFNFGPDESDVRPVQWIVERMVQSWNGPAAWHVDHDSHPHEAGYLKLDCAKAKTKLRWQPRWSLDQALTHVVHWHQAWLSRQDMREFCLQQISSYTKAP